MKKRIVCMTLALMMTAAQVVSVSASREDELREEQAATSAQLDATYAQIDQLYSAKQQLQNEINALDANLVNVMVSIQTLEVDMARAAFELDDTYGIMTRVGLHCAPSAHKTLGTYPAGTLRFSFGPENTTEEVNTALHALAQITGLSSGRVF